MVFFIAFVICMGYLTNYGLKNGDMKKLMAPLDGDDNFCGMYNASGKGRNLTDKPFLYLPQLAISNIKEIFEDGVCVDACPNNSSSIKIDGSGTVNFAPNSAVPDQDTMDKYRQYNTKLVLGYCFPTGDLDP